MKISQSLTKGLADYRFGNRCGLQLKAQYIDGVEFPSSLPMDIGNWFEYMCTGELPRNGVIPEPKMSYVGTKRECLAAPYKKMLSHIDTYNRTMNYHGFKILETGYKFKHKDYSGIADIIAENRAGEKIIIDIKTTGLLNDKWSETGWHIDSIENNEKLMIQAVQYKLLAREEWGIQDIPFFFMVFSTTNENDALIYEVLVDNDRLDQHQDYLEKVKVYYDNEFIKLAENQLAKPSLKRCSECPLSDECKYTAKYIPITQIQY